MALNIAQQDWTPDKQVLNTILSKRLLDFVFTLGKRESNTHVYKVT